MEPGRAKQLLVGGFVCTDPFLTVNVAMDTCCPPYARVLCPLLRLNQTLRSVAFFSRYSALSRSCPNIHLAPHRPLKPITAGHLASSAEGVALLQYGMGRFVDVGPSH